MALEFDAIDSTNAEALRRAAAGECGPLWITAARQTAGRGRAGRAWISARGALAATLLVEPACKPQALPELSLVAGIAAHEAVVGVVPPAARRHVRLKWPNDVLLRGDKLCGILVESTVIGDHLVAAIGVGVNVAAAPELGGRQATSLAASGYQDASSDLGINLAAALAHWLAVWDYGRGFQAIRTSWLERSVPLGELMTVNTGEERVAGAFAGLDSNGALLLDVTGQGRRRFAFGDVALGAPGV
jgi:BirA family biotin operon repressor/biotin-[acetyl-CoA-carboxylase] ligase